MKSSVLSEHCKSSDENYCEAINLCSEIKIIYVRNVNSSKIQASKKKKEFELRNHPNQSRHFTEKNQRGLGMNLVN